ncbi:MAG TPA: S41 family peptidase [Gemmatimonadaceae bacterium]|nr:S41 family peptidase [Gemmatimonadaceae bacterium]
MAAAVTVAVATLTLLPLAARAQGGATAGDAAPLTAAVQAELVDSLGALLERFYPAADTGAMIARHVRERLAAGAYRDVRDVRRFARLVTQDLQSVNGDTHLVVDLAPAGGARGPGGGPPPSHGVERVERLAGNVGYLRMSHFLGGAAAEDAMTAALRYLATTDAILLDLRNSRGGAAELANFLISHFTGPDTVLSLTVYDRARDVTMERYTLADVPGPRRPDVPLFLLTDDVTRSAAEDVAFVLQNMRRATLVGTRTAGAGRNVAGFPLGHGLVAGVSVTRVYDPRTRREWEHVGVRPDVAVPADSALVVAHALALARLAEGAAGTHRRELVLTREAVLAAARPSPVPPATLRHWVGTYEGGQFVTLDGDHLVYQSRVAQPRVPLVALGPTTFAAGATRYEFEEGATGVRLRITEADGAASTYPRTSATVPPRPR